MYDDYIPTEEDLRDFEEWDQRRHIDTRWSKILFTINVKGVPQIVDRSMFIDYLREYIAASIPEYATMTRREIVSILDSVYQVKDELRKFTNLSEYEFNQMLDYVDYPYLVNAWNMMFHQGLIDDIVKDMEIFEILTDTGEDMGRYKKFDRSDVKVPTHVLSDREIIDLIVKDMECDNTESRRLRNNINILLFKKEMETKEHKNMTPAQLKLMLDAHEISITRLDKLFHTNAMMADVLYGISSGMHVGDTLKELFKNTLGVELELTD